jgi:UPF0271 protein
MRAEIDLNADLGEEVTDDAGLLGVVTSANVACGFHAGNAEIMREVCAHAALRGVVLGAHVSYDDRANFGRVARDVAPQVLEQQVADQVGLLASLAAEEGASVAYVKPHGALYHRVATDRVQAAAVLAGAPRLPILGMPGSLLLTLAGAEGRQTRHEGFPDRGYAQDGTLLDRSLPGALLTGASDIAAQALRLAAVVDSVCVHGDSATAVETARYVRRTLVEHGWELRTCWTEQGAG